jgi:hypothetical protein
MVTQYPGHRLNGAILSMPDGIVIGMPFSIVTAMLNGTGSPALFGWNLRAPRFERDTRCCAEFRAWREASAISELTCTLRRHGHAG